ncbi:MAG: phosphoribosylformylglycinamidine synthase subunit PurL [Verrucomicrobiales bacterium]
MNDLLQSILDQCNAVYRVLGPGLPASIYEEALAYELGQNGMTIERGAKATISYKHLRLPLEAGTIVQGQVLVLLQTTPDSNERDKHRLRSAMALLDLPQGVLANFYAEPGQRHLSLIDRAELPNLPSSTALVHSSSTADVSQQASESGPKVDAALAKTLGLSGDEFQAICDLLGRAPNFPELGMFSVMWSEHCAYKNSRPLLRTLPTQGDRVLVKAGEENAGVLDIGDEWAVAFKVESHNHPSAVDPFQGAATGVGGILRDIFTMGARPLFLLDSLKFGPVHQPDSTRNRHLLKGVVAGVSHYGNCMGIPTIGGEVSFDPSYEGNPLVNVFCLGILRHQDIARGSAAGVGNPVFYVGAETGRDGMGGAAFASQAISDASMKNRPAVQVGDPFREKLLMEACLELLTTGSVEGIQDMGAGGLSCAASETASRAGTGILLNLDQVPQREPGMNPYEIMLSESQERMLIIMKKGHEAELERVFSHWELPYAKVGEVTEDGLLHVTHQGRTVVKLPANTLTDQAPVYQRTATPAAALPSYEISETEEPPLAEAWVSLLAHPTLASRRPIFEQYDHMVGTGTVVLPGSDAAVYHHKESGKLLAATSDCNPTFCLLDPRVGTMHAVAEACRNLACSGAYPVGVTNNLNFGNPEKPEHFAQLRDAVAGLGESCRVWGLPITGGNVSLYNEHAEGVINPTPTVCVVGLIEEVKHITTQYFKQAGDAIILLGKPSRGLGGSAYSLAIHNKTLGPCPAIDLLQEKANQEFLLAQIRSGLVASAHDLSEGGLAAALCESAWTPEHTFGIHLFGSVQSRDYYFGEGSGSILLSTRPSNASVLISLAEWQGFTAQKIGVVTNEQILKQGEGSQTLELDLKTLREQWENALALALA